MRAPPPHPAAGRPRPSLPPDDHPPLRPPILFLLVAPSLCTQLTIADMDRAFLSVRGGSQNISVWVNLARACVKRRRTDVAELCLQKMGDARGLASLRAAKRQPEEGVALAAVAIQLGLLDDAANLYGECGRKDLLADLYRARGKWEESLSLNDDGQTKNAHFRYAKHLEGIGELESAREHFEKSGLRPMGFLRMLVREKRVKELENYVLRRKDPELFKWYGAHCESSGDFGRARDQYVLAGDDLSLVRLACHEGDVDAALKTAEESGNKAATYFLARYLEGTGDHQSAVALYGRTDLYNHAIRLAKMHGHTTELMCFALKSTPSQMIACARYFERSGELDKAVQLFVKGGNTSKALDLCMHSVRSKDSDLGYLFISLVDTLGDDAPKDIIDRCAQHLIKIGNHEKAIELLNRLGGKFDEIIRLCMDHGITITDDLADRLSGQVQATERSEMLKKLGKACELQGNFHLASKKFTQAGDRLTAMRCLLRVGNTETIVAYANASKRKEIYIVSANYLQTL